MTLESTINRNRYIGNGVAVEFAFSFRVWKRDQVAVWVGDGTTERDVSASCSIDVTATGGTVTFPSAPSAGTVIVIRRSMPYTQEDDYVNGSRFNSEEVEDRFDMDCAERQDLRLDLSRCVKVPETSDLSADGFQQAVLQGLQALEEAGDATGTSLVKAAGGTEYRALAGRFADVVNVKDFGAKGDGLTDDTEAVQAAISTGKSVYIPAGVYVCTDEITVTTNGQKIFGAGSGGCYFNVDYYPVLYWTDATTLLFKEPANSGVRYVKTRVKYRASSSDPEDNPLSAAINIQAEQVLLEDFCVRLYIDNVPTDPSSDSVSNLGADWDVGIFVGCRPQVKFNHVAVVGYFREACVWFDVTHSYNLPRFADYRTGAVFQNGSGFSGGDCTSMTQCFCYGGRWGVKVQGAIAGANDADYYYNGAAYYDARGSSGFSDFLLLDCEIYGPDHHTGKRIYDMKASPSVADDVDVGGCLSVSGKTRTNTAAIMGHRYISCRFASFAPFRVRLDQTARDVFIACHAEQRGGATVVKRDGTSVAVSAETDFGNFACTSLTTMYRQISCIMTTYPAYFHINKRSAIIMAENAQGWHTGYHNFNITTAGDNTNDVANLNFEKPATSERVGLISCDNSKHMTLSAEEQIASFSNLFKFFMSSGGYFRIMPEHDSSLSDYIISVVSNDVGNGVFVGCGLSPKATSTYDLGGPSNRWNNIYATNGTINTSDSRLKSNIDTPSEALMRAWGKVRFVVFQFNDAISNKGADSARIHVGVVAQEVATAFESEGLDAGRYGLFCYNEWDDEFENVEIIDKEAVLDEEGKVVVPQVSHMERVQTLKAGNLYSIRYEEALALECAYQRWRLEQLEERVNQLTNNSNK